VEEKTNTKKGITKKQTKLQYQKDQMLIKIKGFTKSTKHQLEEHMEYDARQGKPKWKTSMMFMDAIHVHAKRGKRTW